MLLKVKFLQLPLPEPQTVKKRERKVEVVEITFPQRWRAADLRMDSV